MLKQKKKIVEDDEFDDDEEDETEEDDSLEDPVPAQKQVPKPSGSIFNKSGVDASAHHVAGEVTTELMEVGNGTLRPVKRVWANSKESAVSDDPLLVLLCQKLLPQLDTKE